MSSSGLAKLTAGGVIGFAVAYLFDPSRGRSRRAKLQDQAAAVLRRDARRIARRAHYERGRVVGATHRVRHRNEHRPADGRVLADRVRSEALGRMPEIAHRVTIDAYDSAVTLRGQLDLRDDIERVVDAVRRVPGVERVENLLHLPGEAAPNKADALRAHA